jgi:cytochrome c-type biogenesis protein CcmH
MLIWMLFALMLGACVLAVLMPLSRRPVRAPAGVDARAMYDAQMSDIVRDLDRGVISAPDAELARAEVARRLLRASAEETDAPDTVNEATYRRRRVASAVMLLTIPLVTLSLYGAKGSPRMPALPLSARLSSDPERMDFGVALARIETHLQLNPGDGRGWEIVAPIYLRAGRYDDAAAAFANAARHLGPTVDRLVDVGEARFLAAGGIVTVEARAAIDEAAKLGPMSPKGRYYLAVAQEQDGDKAGAAASLRALLSSAPPGAAWAEAVSARIARIEGVPPGGGAVAALQGDERMAAIRGMVEGLAARLQAQGGTAQEWAQLVRARAVLGERDAAAQALKTALAAHASDANAVEQLRALAREAGVEPAP